MSVNPSVLTEAPVPKPEADTPSPSPNSAEDQSLLSRTRAHLLEDVRPSGFVEFELILLTFCTGIQDAISFPDYGCFASNQTGNTVFLVVALILPWLDGDTFFVPNIGAALGFFLLGGWLTGQLSHIIGARMRLWLVCCNLVQTILVSVAAGLQLRYGVTGQGSMAVIVIGLLAFASGSQVVQSRSMKMTEISTAMATAAWVDLVIDPKLLHVKNRPRTRRLMFLVALIGGAILGAGIYRVAGSAVAVFISAAGKLAVTIMYLFNGADKPKQTEGDDNC
ncbi:hypothetical protein F5B22DRAFT_606589 [Xylaria bambusicola]|uniref:uncharacterized protein n=1 Tax=Xylaria bambusicola TaxID=326684 RepID=UPI002007C495|nr:uncharacterized protein F5B22DRAFT_606589 [Xylaria bambusicola]KAI0516812.1 hypothetical protein F5B22DRAFT_606589 [Xylaria bambusicola]